jgi:tRNA nucleotidyltransferase/poly(A) polymerase
MAHLVTAVSPERIAAELRAMVERTGRRRALLLLAETGLAREVLPELAPAHAADDAWAISAAVVGGLDEPVLPHALAVLAADHEAATAARIAGRLRLSNQEAKAIAWLHGAIDDLGSDAGIASRPWSAMQPLVADPRAPLLADLLRARAAHGLGDASAAAWFTAQVARPRAEIDPPPLVTGDDLLAAGAPAGRGIGAALAKARQLQLDGKVTTKEQALAAARG